MPNVDILEATPSYLSWLRTNFQDFMLIIIIIIAAFNLLKPVGRPFCFFMERYIELIQWPNGWR